MQGGIPRPSEPVLKYNRDGLKGLPFSFPTTIIRFVHVFLSLTPNNKKKK